MLWHAHEDYVIPNASPEVQAEETAKFEKAEAKLKEKALAVAAQFKIPEENFDYEAVSFTDQSSKAEVIAKEIIAEIKKKDIDLIVMGCRNTKMKKFLGSVSDYIIKETNAVCLVKKFE